MRRIVVSTRIRKRGKETPREAGIEVPADSGNRHVKVAASIRAEKSLERLNKTIEKMMTPP